MILGSVTLPEQDNDQYAAWEDVLTTSVEMISGRVVQEVRGRGDRYKVWRARIAFDYLEDEVFQAVYPMLKSGKAFSAFVLPPNGTELVGGSFLVESLTDPSFAFDDGGEAVWRGLAFQIREVSPHA